MGQSVEPVTPEEELLAGGQEPPQHESVTSVVDDLLAEGAVPDAADEEIPGEDEVLQAGDPDVDPLAVEYSGDDAPGASNSSPDANDVDETGRLFGISGADEGRGLVLGAELVDPRDHDRWENNPASRDRVR